MLRAFCVENSRLEFLPHELEVQGLGKSLTEYLEANSMKGG